MIIWIDAQLSPHMASWIQGEFQINAVAIRDLGLRDATDNEIFASAKRESVVVLTFDWSEP